MQPMVNVAISAARKAGKIIMQASDNLDRIEVSSKGNNDFVSNVDRQAESAIINIIKKAYPDHAIQAEESGESGEHEYKWVIDPLDGTTNFVHGFGHFSVSIAILYKNKPEHAVIYDPVRQELFSATRGKGASLNNRQRLRVSKHKTIEASLLGTGFPFKDKTHITPYLKTFTSVLPLAAGIRRAGSAALDLAYVAAGRLDGYWEFGLKPWDMAAGILLLKEAGGLISDIDGTDNFYESGNVVCGNPSIFKSLLKTFNGSLKA